MNLTLLDKFLYRDMPQALMQAYYSAGNSLSAITQAQVVATGDVTAKTYTDGYTWSIENTSRKADEVTILIAVDSGAQATALNSRIAETGNIKKKAVSESNLKITYQL